MKFLKRFKRKTLIWSGIVVVGLILIFLNAGGKPVTPRYEEIKVARQDLAEMVSVTGKVMPAQSVDLAFERGGRVASVNAEVNQKIGLGQVLAGLEAGEVAAERNQALARLTSAQAILGQYQATLVSDQAHLQEIKNGATHEELRLAQTKRDRAVVVLNEAKLGVIDNLKDSYFKAEDSIRNKMDPLFSDPRGTNPQILIIVTDSQLEINIEWSRYLLEDALLQWRDYNDQLTVDSDLRAALQKAQRELTATANYLADLAQAVNYSPPNTAFSQTTLDTYKTTIGTARTTINTALGTATTAQEKWRTAEAALTVTQRELEVTEAGNRAEQITGQEAKVRASESLVLSQRAAVQEAEANVQRLNALLAKTVIRAPFSGTVTFRNLEVGEIIAANTKVFSLLSETGLQVEAFIPETDIAKIGLDNKASLSIDALGNAPQFEARVIKIDPAETILDGVTTYKTTLAFVAAREQVKSGMTADLEITTRTVERALALPRRAVVNKDSQSYVLLPAATPEAAPIEKPVTTGLTSFEGLMEITAGLIEGETVLISL